jgi:hypothetical protein
MQLLCVVAVVTAAELLRSDDCRKVVTSAHRMTVRVYRLISAAR